LAQPRPASPSSFPSRAAHPVLGRLAHGPPGAACPAPLALPWACRLARPSSPRAAQPAPPRVTRARRARAVAAAVAALVGPTHHCPGRPLFISLVGPTRHCPVAQAAASNGALALAPARAASPLHPVPRARPPLARLRRARSSPPA
jgi:hypothetical protein